MASVDLVFALDPITGQPVDLVFGEIETELANKGRIEFTLGLPVVDFAGDSVEPPAVDGTISFTLGLPVPLFAGDYNINVERPTVGHVRHDHTEADLRRPGVTTTAGDGADIRALTVSHHTLADPVRPGVRLGQDSGERRRAGSAAYHTEADPLRASAGMQHQESLRDRRPSVQTAYQEGDGRRSSARTRHQERYRDRRPAIGTRHTEGLGLQAQVHTLAGKGLPFVLRRRNRHQEAMRPPPGMYVAPIPPLPNPCYDPSAHLLFADAFGATPQLLFFCENHEEPPPLPGEVVVPVRSVYIVLNDVYLKRVAGSVMLPATSMSLSIDVDSWTWSFSASLPVSAMSNVEPVAGEPVELEANINGSLYRVIVEQISSDRTFGSHNIRVSGRGKSALLASPYAPILSFANSETRTAQQLMVDVLTLNSIPLGWDIDWQLDDWLVPAGVFGMQGSYMDALTAISGAAGAYIQPHPTDQELSVLLRYPVLPWDWGTVTPNFVLPSAVATREGIEWKDKPLYNRVYVSGQASGVLGRVTRAGTAGDVHAQMVTDALITEAAAARQRGSAILADTGRQALVNLGLPVLSATGVIAPGKFVRYEDPTYGNRFGIVRATNVEVSGGGANVKQSITLETRA